MKNICVIFFTFLSFNIYTQDLKPLRGVSSTEVTSLETFQNNYTVRPVNNHREIITRRNSVNARYYNYQTRTNYNQRNQTKMIIGGVLSIAGNTLLNNYRWSGYRNYSRNLYSHWWYPRPRLYNSPDYLHGYWRSQFNFQRGVNRHF